MEGGKGTMWGRRGKGGGARSSKRTPRRYAIRETKTPKRAGQRGGGRGIMPAKPPEAAPTAYPKYFCGAVGEAPTMPETAPTMPMPAWRLPAWRMGIWRAATAICSLRQRQTVEFLGKEVDFGISARKMFALGEAIVVQHPCGKGLLTSAGSGARRR